MASSATEMPASVGARLYTPTHTIGHPRSTLSAIPPNTKRKRMGGFKPESAKRSTRQSLLRKRRRDDETPLYSEESLCRNTARMKLNEPVIIDIKNDAQPRMRPHVPLKKKEPLSIEAADAKPGKEVLPYCPVPVFIPQQSALLFAPGQGMMMPYQRQSDSPPPLCMEDEQNSEVPWLTFLPPSSKGKALPAKPSSWTASSHGMVETVDEDGVINIITPGVLREMKREQEHSEQQQRMWGSGGMDIDDGEEV